MNEILYNSMVEKINTQDEKLAAVQEQVKNIPRLSEEIQEIRSEVNHINTGIQQLNFPVMQMQELTSKLAINNQLLSQPAVQEVRHHHHIGIGILVIIVLCISVIAAGSGFFITVEKLKYYKASDTKYRFLKLQNNKNLQQLLSITDSLYLVDHSLRDSVIRREELNKRNAERLHRATKMEQEAKQLRKKAKEK